MSVSNHSICEPCYHEQRRIAGLPRKEPIRVWTQHPRLIDRCCWCGSWHHSHIWVRADPGRLECNHWKEVVGDG